MPARCRLLQIVQTMESAETVITQNNMLSQNLIHAFVVRNHDGLHLQIDNSKSKLRNLTVRVYFREVPAD